MVTRNPDIAQLEKSYLFVEIAQRKAKILKEQPDAQLINLGIGDTTEPLSPAITEALIEKAKQLGEKQTYSGYGDPFGDPLLRAKIAEKVYQNRVSAEEIFISDGAKCDLGRLQLLFPKNCTALIQDPAYPAYVGSSLMTGKRIQYIPCLPSNAFCPTELPEADLLYLCSPNNPTGAVLTHAQLAKVVQWAQKQSALILFDAAYASFIRDPTLPRSIFEIEGAKNVAIEMNSFSKMCGFTGVRLGWSVVPHDLRFADGASVQADWIKIVSTFFNGASNLAQAGGLQALHTPPSCDLYMGNAQLLHAAVEEVGLPCHGGANAPYIWVDMQGQKSWDCFDFLLNEVHLITTPGVGFGPSGEGFIRLSSFGSRESILEACARIKKTLYMARSLRI